MANGNKKYTVQEGVNLQLGQAGYDYTTGTATISNGPYIAFTVLQGDDDAGDSALENGMAQVTLTSADTNIWDTVTDGQFPVGATIYGRWTSLTVTGATGAIIAYRG